MTFTTVLSVVAYRNRDQVVEFVKRARLNLGPEIGIAICDNTPLDASGSHAELQALEDDATTVVARPDNPGYLEGGLVGLEAFHVRRNPSRWCILSNTDLQFVDSSGFSDLAELADTQILAPRISEVASRREMNPHLVAPRSDRRVAMDHLLTRNTQIAMLYLLGHRLKQYVGLRAAQRDLAPPGTQMSQPYGAMVIMPTNFALRLPRNVPLLAEEFVIAEYAQMLGIPVKFQPNIHVRHFAHSVMGLRTATERASMLSKAFEYCARMRKQ